MPWIVANEVKFFYQQKGTGPDVVLIHGVTGNMAIWPLIDLIDNLASDFRVTYYDLRGHGYSDTPSSGYTSAEMAADLRALQEALELGPSYLVGHSFGGVIAMHAAVAHPERVRGVILSDPYFPALHELEMEITDWVGWPRYVQQGAAAGIEVTPENCLDIDHLLSEAAGLSDQKRQMFIDTVGKPALERLVRLAGTTCGKDTGQVAGLTVERICQVECPVLALFGEGSPFLATCRFLESHLRDCRVALVPGAEHLAHEENPQQFVAIVSQVLRQMAGMVEGWNAATAEPAGGDS